MSTSGCLFQYDGKRLLLQEFMLWYIKRGIEITVTILYEQNKQDNLDSWEPLLVETKYVKKKERERHLPGY